MRLTGIGKPNLGAERPAERACGRFVVALKEQAGNVDLAMGAGESAVVASE